MYQIGKHAPYQDPYPYESEKHDPDPYQKGLDLQHWAKVGKFTKRKKNGNEFL